MSVSNLQKPASKSVSTKPLSRLQEYLVETKHCVALFRELLVEVKELIVVLALIAFFVWGVIELFKHLHG